MNYKDRRDRKREREGRGEGERARGQEEKGKERETGRRQLRTSINNELKKQKLNTFLPCKTVGTIKGRQIHAQYSDNLQSAQNIKVQKQSLLLK